MDGGSPPRIPFTVHLPMDVAEQLHEAARVHGLSDEELAAQALARGLPASPDLTVAWMKGSRARLSSAAVIALGRPSAVVIDLLGGEILEIQPAMHGIPVRYDQQGEASFPAGALRALADPQTVRLSNEGTRLVGRLINLRLRAAPTRTVTTNLPGLAQLDISALRKKQMDRRVMPERESVS